MVGGGASVYKAVDYALDAKEYYYDAEDLYIQIRGLGTKL